MELILAAALLVILIMLIQTVKRKNLKEKRLNEQGKVVQFKKKH